MNLKRAIRSFADWNFAQVEKFQALVCFSNCGIQQQVSVSILNHPHFDFQVVVPTKAEETAFGHCWIAPQPMKEACDGGRQDGNQ